MLRHLAARVWNLALSGLLSVGLITAAAGQSPPQAISADLDRSPVDLDRSPDGRWLVTANQGSDSVSLIRAEDLRVVDEIACGSHPADIAFTPDGGHVLVTAEWSGGVHVLEIADDSLRCEAVIEVGSHPHGIAISADSTRAYVGLMAGKQVAEIDLPQRRVSGRFDVGNWPQYLTLSRDGRLAVGNGGDGEITVIDTASGESIYDVTLSNGINLGQMRTSADGRYAYFTWMVYRTNPINEGNIRRGWVLASRIGRVRLDGPAHREAISLDVPGEAVADPHDLEISSDGQRLVASAAGTHELLVYRLPDLPFVAQGGPGDLIDRSLQNDRERFDRIPLGGRPLGLRIDPDNRTVYVANYLRNSVQVVDLPTRQLRGEIDLGGPDNKTLVRKGMEIFYDGQRSLDQWYSCHSCHQDGGVNSRPMDTMNDGTEMTLKTVLPLHRLAQTFPWTWHGWQHDLSEAMHTSITSTMQGKPPSQEDERALIAFLAAMPEPPNPFLTADGGLSEAASRGKQLFFSRKAGCADCHHGANYSDGKIHDVGLGSESDHYQGYNTPSLVGTYRKVRWLHNGKARSLESVLDEFHRPEMVNGEGGLSEQETADLVEFLRSL